MRVLIGNKFWHPKGGVEAYLFELVRELPAYGYEPVPFAMAAPDNWESDYSEHFVDNADYEDREISFQNFRNSARIIYSIHARRKLTELVKISKPNLAHIHNIYHQISPSILPALRQRHIPVLMTLHDLKLACPNYKMRTHGEICERCLPAHYYQAVLHRCVKNSLLASALCATELYLHRHLNLYQDNVNRFIVPSEFYKKKFIESGIPERKLVCIPNFTRVELYTPRYDSSDYIVYTGRLSEEKGLITLLEAMQGFKAGKLLIIGDGPLRLDLQGIIDSNALTNVHLLGPRWGDELRQIVEKAKFSIIPSEWYENCPMSCIESFATGKPVIGANIGGIPELIDDGHTGLLFESGNAEELRESIEKLYRDPKLVSSLGKNARHKAETKYSVDVHMARLMREYSDVLGSQTQVNLAETNPISGQRRQL